MAQPDNTKLKRLIDKLKELFQLDQPELDFGIYRIMHAKSEEVTQFLERDLGLVPNMDAFLAALGKHPAIEHWAFSGSRPARDTQGQIELHVSPSQHKTIMRLTTVSPGFFDTYGMTLLAGTPRVGSGEAHLVIDAKAARLLGFATPQAAVGALLRGGGGFLQEGNELRRVVAVVNDVKLESARDAAMPQGFLLSDQPQWDLTVHGPDATALHKALEDLWKSAWPAARLRHPIGRRAACGGLPSGATTDHDADSDRFAGGGCCDAGSLRAPGGHAAPAPH